MMPLIDISTSHVIREVEKRPVIWDTNNAMYRSKHARKRAWLEVVNSLIPSFKTMDNAQKLETDRAVQQRWKTARDAYMRNKGMIKANTGVTKYFYYDLLSFLDPIEEARTKKPSGQSSKEAGSSYDPLDQIQTEFSPEIILKSEYRDNLEFEDENGDDAADDGGNSDESDSWNRTVEHIHPDSDDNIPKKRKRRTRKSRSVNEERDKDKTDTMLEMLKDYLTKMQNDDMAFFLSMLPMLSKLTLQQKLQFRSKLINIIMELNTK